MSSRYSAIVAAYIVTLTNTGGTGATKRVDPAATGSVGRDLLGRSGGYFGKLASDPNTPGNISQFAALSFQLESSEETGSPPAQPA